MQSLKWKLFNILVTKVVFLHRSLAPARLAPMDEQKRPVQCKAEQSVCPYLFAVACI